MMADGRLRLAEQAHESPNVDFRLLHQVVQNPQPRFITQQLEQTDEVLGICRFQVRQFMRIAVVISSNGCDYGIW